MRQLQDVCRRQQAILAAFKKQKNAEKVRRQVAVDMAEPVVQQKLDEIRRMLKLDELLSMNGEAQPMEAPFDGASGEAASSADVLDGLELEDLWLETVTEAAAETIKGLDGEVEGLSSIVRDLEDQVEQLEGDAATSAAATKDAMEKMQNKIAKLDACWMVSSLRRRPHIGATWTTQNQKQQLYTQQRCFHGRGTLREWMQKPNAKARSGNLDRRKSRTYIRVSSENMCSKLMSWRNECVNWSQIELEQPRCNNGSQEQQTRKRRCNS